jgi:thioredoxin reductase (NADPH)
MGQPILFLVNDQGRVLDALAGDLARRFGVDYQILSEGSPSTALVTLEQLADRSEEVALVIAAERMREVPGVEFLVRAHELHPTAKRVLLVGRRDWTSTNPAVRAMSLGQIDTYLFEPWLPVERWLYLPISQVLADWAPSQAASFDSLWRLGCQG